MGFDGDLTRLQGVRCGLERRGRTPPHLLRPTTAHTSLLLWTTFSLSLYIQDSLVHVVPAMRGRCNDETPRVGGEATVIKTDFG